MNRSYGRALLFSLLLPAMAAALPLTEYQAQRNDTLDLYVAGSSAQDRTLEGLFRVLCDPGTLDEYRANGGDVRLMFCRSKNGSGAIPGIAAGQKIALHKSSVSGSGSGVGPLIQRTPVQFVNVADLRAHFEERCAPDKARQIPAEGALIAYTEYQCANPAPTLEIPDAGITDVNPRFFLSAYHLTPEALEALSVHSANAFIFGIPVTLSLRNALQSARFPVGSPCNPANPHYADVVVVDKGMGVPRGETEPCMPGLTRAQLAGIFAGTLTQWRQIVNAQGAPIAFRNLSNGRMESPAGVRPPDDERVHVCRRVPTSGTQAAYEMFFLNQRCATGVRPFIENGPNVFLGSTSGDVKNCLAELDHRNIWAVGILSTENVESLKDDRWRFVKMDGVAPTLLNTFNGRWPFFVEQSYQWRNEHAEQPLQGPKLALMAQIGLQLGNPAIIRDLDRGFRHAWGRAGVMALNASSLGVPAPAPAPGKPVDEAALAENPILGLRHEPNNCGAALAESPTVLP